MSFRTVAISASMLFLIVATVLLLFPNLIYWLFAVPGNETASFIGRRAAALFLGLTCMCLLACNLPRSQARDAIAKGVIVAMVGLVLLGTYEFARGFVGPGIFLAMAVEALIAVALVSNMGDRTIEPPAS